MNIDIINTDDFQHLKIYMEVQDYIKLFKEEAGYGKLLRIYDELGKIISENESKLREWIKDNRYKSMVDTTNKVASIINNNGNTTDKEIFDIYPLTIVNDRYNGTYSGGKYTAWNLYPWGIPEAVFGDDNSCWSYFRSTHDIYGCGDTPDDAVIDLRKRLAVADAHDKLIKEGLPW